MARKIEDFGEKIGGAKKDKWREFGMQLADLTDLNDLELENYVKRDNIWSIADYSKLNMTDTCKYYVKLMLEKLPAKLNVTKNESARLREYAENYVQFIQELKSYTVANLKEDKDIVSFMSRFLKDCGYYLSNHIRSSKSKRNTIMDSRFVYYCELSSYDVSKLRCECEIQNFPTEFRSALRGLRVGSIRGMQGGSSVSYVFYKDNKYVYQDYHFDSENEAYEFAKTTLHDVIDKAKEEHKVIKKASIKVVRPQLEHIARISGNIRNGNDATGDILIKAFKFRGGEFGNWNSDNDRQACLNYAFDAFCDLAYILDIPVSGISL